MACLRVEAYHCLPRAGKKMTTNCLVTFLRSNHPEVFFKNGVLKNLAKLTGEHLRQSLFSIKLKARGLRTPFSIERFQWLLLILKIYILEVYLQGSRFSSNFEGCRHITFRKIAFSNCYVSMVPLKKNWLCFGNFMRGGPRALLFNNKFKSLIIISFSVCAYSRLNKRRLIVL